MSGFDLIRAAYDVAGLDEHERAVLVLLAFMANDEAKAWPSIAHIVERTGKGERTIQRAIQRLCAAGHLGRKQLRNGVIYSVHPSASGSTPAPPTPVSDTPVQSTGVPRSPRPVPQTPKQPRTTNSQDTSYPSKGAPAEQIPEWIPAVAWNGFVEMRRRMKAPLTGRAVTLTINELTALRDAGQDPGAVLDQSVARGWRGVFSIKENNNGRAATTGASRSSAPHESTGNPILRAALAGRVGCGEAGSNGAVLPRG